MPIKYLTTEHVLSFHDNILKDTQEDKGLAPHTSIDSALNRIDDHIAYDGLENIYEIAALYGIAVALKATVLIMETNEQHFSVWSLF